MLSWSEFRIARPDLAEAGRELFYQFGVGLAFLGTVRGDGGPRMHPVCPIIFDGGLYGFIIPSPKLNDLRRDPRYALHSHPTPTNDDAFYLTGLVRHLDDALLRKTVADCYFAERQMTEPWPGFEAEAFVEYLIETCLLTRTHGHGGPYEHTVWKAPSQRAGHG